MTLPHVAGVDVIAAEEIGSILAQLEAIDRDLEERGRVRRGDARKSLLEHKAWLSRESHGVAARDRGDRLAARTRR